MLPALLSALRLTARTSRFDVGATDSTCTVGGVLVLALPCVVSCPLNVALNTCTQVVQWLLG